MPSARVFGIDGAGGVADALLNATDQEIREAAGVRPRHHNELPRKQPSVFWPARRGAGGKHNAQNDLEFPALIRIGIGRKQALVAGRSPDAAGQACTVTSQRALAHDAFARPPRDLPPLSLRRSVPRQRERARRTRPALRPRDARRRLGRAPHEQGHWRVMDEPPPAAALRLVRHSRGTRDVARGVGPERALRRRGRLAARNSRLALPADTSTSLAGGTTASSSSTWTEGSCGRWARAAASRARCAGRPAWR